MKYPFVVAAIIAVAGHSAFGQISPARTISSAQTSAAPKIDGVIDDQCWQRLPDTSDFWLLETGTSGSERTDAWICSDKDSIYVAFRCHDSQPSKISAQQRKRGGSINTDDSVRFEIDPWHAHRSTYSFNVTPRGTQTEYIPGSGGTKVEWNGDWHAAAKTDASGWTAEMAIPWSMLKYTKGQNVMGVSFSRKMPRFDQRWMSPNLGPNYDNSLMFDWTGVTPPAPKLDTLLLQYTNLGYGGVSFKNGLDIKKQLNQQTNVLITANPDFDSIEQSIANIDFTYSPLVLSDNRPFFAEGNSHQNSEYRMFYSRNIENVDIGAKIAGQTSSNDFSGLITTSGSGDRHIYYKSKWDFGTYSKVGFAFTNTKIPGVENSVGSAYLRLGKRTDERSQMVEYRVMQSFTPGPGRDGRITVAGIGSWGGPKQLQGSLYYQDISPDYYAADGIVPDPDLKGWNYDLTYGDEYSSGLWRGWSVDMSGNDWRLHSGDPLDRNIYIGTTAWTVKNIYNLAFSSSSRRDSVDGLVYDMFRDRIYTLGFGWNQDNMYKRGWASVDFGRRAGGSSVYVYAKKAFPLASNLHLDTLVEYLKMTGPFAQKARQSVATVSYDISSERSLSGRILEQNGNINFTFGFRQAVRKGQDIYILFGDPNVDKTTNRITVKFIRPWM